MILGIDITTGKPFDITPDALRRHIYIIGKSGTGKSALLRNMLADLITAGYGAALLDPHGDLAESVADCIPKSRFNDAIYWEPFDLSYSVGYNPLSDTEKDMRPLVSENVLSAFSHVWGLSSQHTPRLLHILRNSLRLLLDNPDTSLVDLQRLLTDKSYRTQLLRKCEDDTVRTFWEGEFAAWNDRQRGEYVASLQNKIGALVANPAMRNILSAKSTIHPDRIMNTGKLLIVNLSKGRMGEESSSLLGALLATGFAQAAHGRADMEEEKRRDFALVIDEFQNFTTTAFAQILSEARKYRLNLVVAHQFMSQVPAFLQDAVIGTANTTIAFRCGANDAPLLASELDIDQPKWLKNLPNFQALVRTIQDNVPSETHQIATFPPSKPLSRLKAVRNRTRARYARKTLTR